MEKFLKCKLKMGGAKDSLKAFLFTVIALIAGSMLFVSCAGGAGGGSSESTATSLCVRMPTTRATYAVSDVEIFTVSISSSSYSSTKSCGQGESLTFANIPVGHYSVTAYGKTALGNIAAKGTTSVDVEANITKEVSIKLSRLDFYMVTFKTVDGSTYTTQKVTAGYTATKPANPSSATLPAPFSFWATSATATTAFSFATPITSDITLYAVCGATTAATSFSGTVEQFLATEFANTSSATSPYPITITGVTNDNLDDIIDHLREFSTSDGTKRLWCELTLSGADLTEIYGNAFGGTVCIKYITKLRLPDSVIKINGSAFAGCENLCDLELPASVEEIGGEAFYSLGSASGVGVAITLPASVKKIYSDTFSSSNLTSLTVEGENSWNATGSAPAAGITISVSCITSPFSPVTTYSRD